MTEQEIKEGWISSNESNPPFKTLVETYTPFGYTNKAMFHESENDGYDLLNENPKCVHIIDDFEHEVIWRSIVSNGLFILQPNIII